MHLTCLWLLHTPDPGDSFMSSAYGPLFVGVLKSLMYYNVREEAKIIGHVVESMVYLTFEHNFLSNKWVFSLPGIEGRFT